MELTQDQIQQLFQFTEKKYVRWYDLQVELVDHLASKIEEEMSVDASLTFDAALDKVYKSFGMFGFAKVVQEKEAQVSKAARRMWWKEIGAFFKIPKIAFFLFLIALLWQIALYINVEYLTIAYIFIYFICDIILGRKFLKKKNKRKPLLLLQISPLHSSLFVFFFQYWILFDDMYKTPPFLFSLIATTGIIIMIASYQVYFKVRAQAQALYPEAFEQKVKLA